MPLQIEYAALDAMCLLMLLDNMITCAPAQFSSQNPDTTAQLASKQYSDTNSPYAPAIAAEAGRLAENSASISSLDGLSQRGTCVPRQQSVACQTHHLPNPALHQTAGSPEMCVGTIQGTSGTNHGGSQQPANNTADASTSGTNHGGSQQPANNTADASTSGTNHGGSQQLGNNTAASASSSTVQLSTGATVGISIPAADQSAATLGQQADNRKDDAYLSNSHTGHHAAIQQAVEHWACRLEMSQAGKAAKPRARRHLSRRQRAHIRHAVEQQNQIDDVAGAHRSFRHSYDLSSPIRLCVSSVAWRWLAKEPCITHLQNRNELPVSTKRESLLQGLLCLCHGRTIPVSHVSYVTS